MPKYKIILADLYLTWLNDFLSVDCFSEYLETDSDSAKKIIELGKQYHNERAERLQKGLTV